MRFQLLAEVTGQQAGKRLAETSFVAGHLVDRVVNLSLIHISFTRDTATLAIGDSK